MSSNSELRKRLLLAEANQAIDGLHRSFDLADSNFFCECGQVGCKERITLTRDQYAVLRGEAEPLIAQAHVDREAGELEALRGQVDQLQGTLASRVHIEQAKGVLIERHGMTPDAAFETLRARARAQRQSLDEVCAHIIAWAGIHTAEHSDPAPSNTPQPRRESHER